MQTGTIHNAIYNHKDIMNTSDIKGTKPDGNCFRYRNIDKDQITSEQIRHQPDHKQRHENYGLKIRNPLFQDFYYKDLTQSQMMQSPQTAGNVQNQKFNQDYPQIPVPQTAKNIYGSDVHDLKQRSTPYLPHSKYQPVPQDQLGSIYNSKPLRYDTKPFRDHGYPYPKGPTDIRPPISTPFYQDNIISPLAGAGGVAGKKEILNYSKFENFTPQPNNSLLTAKNNNKNDNIFGGGNQTRFRQNNSMVDLTQNKKSQIFTHNDLRSSQVQQAPYMNQKPQNENNFSNLNNGISKEWKQQFKQPSKLPDIKQDMQKAQEKALGIQQPKQQQQLQTEHYNNSAQGQDYYLGNKNNNHNLRKQSQPFSSHNQQKSLNNLEKGEVQRENFNVIYNENYGHKNVQNRYQMRSQHIPRAEHIYKDAGEVNGNLLEKSGYNYHPNHANAYSQNKNQSGIEQLRSKSHQYAGYQNKDWKPLNIISGKRHQQYTTTLDHPAWDWKVYDREKFNDWDGQKSHIKDIIKQKNRKINTKREFSTANHEYGNKN